MTPRQLSLDDIPPTAQAAKEAGMQRSADKAGAVWVGYATLKLKELCETQPTVWAGDLRRVCELTPASDQAWATPWAKAHREGWISRLPVDKRPADWDKARKHQCDVFKSLLYGQRRAAA